MLSSSIEYQNVYVNKLQNGKEMKSVVTIKCRF